MSGLLATALLIVLVTAWLAAVERSAQPRAGRTPWSRLELREALRLAWAGAVRLGRVREELDSRLLSGVISCPASGLTAGGADSER